MKILIPVDGSEHADAALAFVAARATLIGAEPEIRLINVQPTLSSRIVRAVGRDEARAFQRTHADEVLQPALAKLKRAGVPARASYALGDRPDVIGAIAIRDRADLIIMGSRGHSGLKGVLFGSMTNAVLAGCTKPLLIVRSARVPRGESLKVGIAVDGSRYGQAAVRWVLKHRDFFGVEPSFELIHVLNDAETEQAQTRGARRRTPADHEQVSDDDARAPLFDRHVADAVRSFGRAGLPATIARLRGAVAGDAIASYARERRLDLLVMGSHGHGVFKSLVLGSVAMRVAARCDKPLLVIREAGRRKAD